MFLDRKKCEASTLTFSPNQHLTTFTPRRGHCRHFSPSPPPPCSPTTEPPPPCLNILHLFNYLAATLWFGPEPQWKLYLPIRAGLVTGAGQISPSCRRLRERDAFGHITQEEMSLPHCRLVIPSLWSPRGSEDLYVCEGVCVCVCVCVWGDSLLGLLLVKLIHLNLRHLCLANPYKSNFWVVCEAEIPH